MFFSETWARSIERLHIHSNKNDVINFCNISDIMPYLYHIVVPTLRDVVLQIAGFLKGKDTHHICYLFPHIANNYLPFLKCHASIK